MTNHPSTTIVGNGTLRGDETIIIDGRAVNLAECPKIRVRSERPNIDGATLFWQFTLPSGAPFVIGAPGWWAQQVEVISATYSRPSAGMRRSSTSAFEALAKR